MTEPTLPRLAFALLVGHAHAVYWFAIIKAVRALDSMGAVGAAEWVSRVTGLRARLEALLRE